MSKEEDRGVSGAQIPRGNDHKGGKINRYEPITTKELIASPLIVSCFKYVGCFVFSERVQQI